MSSRNEKKRAHEARVAEAFCDAYRHMSGHRAEVIEISDAPDALIKVDNREIVMELAGYREQGAHNNSFTSDEQIKAYLCDLWDANPHLQYFSVSLGFREQKTAFLVPRAN